MRNTLLWFAVYAGCVASLVVFCVTGGLESLRDVAVWIPREAQTAAIFFVPSITTDQIRSNYATLAYKDTVTGVESHPGPTKKVRILIVPGHQPDAGGTVYGGVYERDVVADIADSLAALLEKNPHYEVTVARTKDAWNPILQSYFDTHVLEIETFFQSQRAKMAGYIANGSILQGTDDVYHNSSSATGTLQLYGINKWTSDNEYDITLHLHINDYAGRRLKSADAYTGFAIYVPDHQYSNATASKAIGESISARLNAYHATSTLPGESAGVVEDQELIAIGSNNSSDDAALLIEYGYIYEPQFQNESIRQTAVADYAHQTYLGLQDFFQDSVSSAYGSIALTYDWATVTAKEDERGVGIYALQSALRYLGYYPPSGESFGDCPISGHVGSCTRSAIEAYQRANGFEATGTLGPQTRAALKRDLAEP